MQIMILHRSSFYTSIKAILKRLGIRSLMKNDSYIIESKHTMITFSYLLGKRGKIRKKEKRI